ncbi:hypothetical protein ARMSODRAFT_209003 [Armillaria solidipes]|uniref:Secreted protein n=1 Tax=Armillaria solidipes TaxID=1076256 RepID=A0A2H3BQ40_9AGAR|nr:hypothetical protein ARMSODRAFT_209003 [Armillaria solidipes]
MCIPGMFVPYFPLKHSLFFVLSFTTGWGSSRQVGVSCLLKASCHGNHRPVLPHRRRSDIWSFYEGYLEAQNNWT